MKRKIYSSSILLFLLLFCSFSVFSETPSEDNIKRYEILETAKKYIGVKYAYGGSSNTGFDCSGFVMYIYGLHDIKLSHSSSAQYYAAKKITKKEARPGDLVFFTTYKKGPSHVGIYMGSDEFIHSPSTGKKVQVASINNSYWKKRIIGFATYL
ncbi:MAG: C40 family peptidase [Spirochaetes bacterium]|nr:C40 family peptidase [Spirochaetota bacterium]